MKRDISSFITEYRTPIIKILRLIGLAVAAACCMAVTYRHFGIPAWIVVLTVYTAVALQVVAMALINRKHPWSENTITWVKREIDVIIIAVGLCILEQTIVGV